MAPNQRTQRCPLIDSTTSPLSACLVKPVLNLACAASRQHDSVLPTCRQWRPKSNGPCCGGAGARSAPRVQCRQKDDGAGSKRRPKSNGPRYSGALHWRPSKLGSLCRHALGGVENQLGRATTLSLGDVGATTEPRWGDAVRDG
jgi:hypothetical protein